MGLSSQAGGNRIDENTIDLPENDFGLLAAIGPVLRQVSVHHPCCAVGGASGGVRPSASDQVRDATSHHQIFGKADEP